jgi:hypothetical protein
MPKTLSTTKNKLISKQLSRRETSTKKIKIKVNIGPFKKYLMKLNVINKKITFENVGLEYSIKTIVNLSRSAINEYTMLENYKTLLFSFIKHIIFKEIELYYLDLDFGDEKDKKDKKDKKENVQDFGNIEDNDLLSFSRFKVDITKNEIKEYIISDTDIQETYTSQFDRPEFAMPLVDIIKSDDGLIEINIYSFVKPNAPINTQPKLKLYQIANSYLIIKDTSNLNEKTFAFISKLKDENINIEMKYLNLPEYLIKEKINSDYIDKRIIEVNKIYYGLEKEERQRRSEPEPEEEYEDDETETEATTGGSNNKYQIYSDKKTNFAYIKYNNKKSYFYKKENENKIFIKIDNKIINITKKSLSYNSKLNSTFLLYH